MHLKKPEDTNIIPIMDAENSNIISIMDPPPAVAISLEAIDVVFAEDNDDNPFFNLDDDIPEKVEEAPEPVKISRKCADFGPGPEKLKWYYRQQDAFDNYVQGKTIISADTNSASSKSIVY